MARVGIRLKVVPADRARRLRMDFGDDRHSDGCAACAFYDTYRRLYGFDARVAAQCAKHILTDHEPVG